jgi:hypothetical protein
LYDTQGYWNFVGWAIYCLFIFAYTMVIGLFFRVLVDDLHLDGESE